MTRTRVKKILYTTGFVYRFGLEMAAVGEFKVRSLVWVGGGGRQVFKNQLRQLFRYKSRKSRSSSCCCCRYNNACIIYFRQVFFFGSRLNVPTSSAAADRTQLCRAVVRICYITTRSRTVVNRDHSNHGNTY